MSWTLMADTESTPLTELVRQAQLGVESAHRALIQAYQRRLAGFIYTIVGRTDAVEDLVQGVFIRMVRNVHRLDNTEQFEAWLFRLAKNISIDHLRRQRWRHLLSPLDPEVHGDIAAPVTEVDAEELDALRYALDQLKPADRALIALAQEGRSQNEMAEITGVSLVAVKARLHRAREALKKFYHEAS